MTLHRYLLLGCGFVYLLWWFAVEAFLPGSYNPFGGRAVIVGLFWVVWAASFRVEFVRRRLETWLGICLALAVIHYFYLFHFNHADINWVIGSYITAVVASACFQSAGVLLAFSAWMLALSTGLGFLNPHLFMTIFLPGMVTILLFANLALRFRLRLTARAAEAGQRVQSLFDAAFEGIAVHDQGVILDANESLARILGYTRAELIGRHVSQFTAPALRSLIEDRIRTAHDQPYEAMALRKDGSLLAVEMVGKLHLLQGRPVRLTAVRDVSDQKQAERTRIIYEATRRALQSRDEFISNVSHELKTPLTIIKFQAQLTQRALQRTDVDPATAALMRPFAEQTDRQVNRLVRLVDDMLDISRIASGHLQLKTERIDLARVVRETVDSLSDALAEASCVVDVHAEPGVFVQADRYRMEQLTLNLLTNAAKYGRGKPILVSCDRHEGRAHLSVRDFGFGISEADQARIFERFERTPDARHISGLGLGLYICRQIVEAHAGTISVESAPGRGAMFSVSLPAELEASPASP